MPNLFDENPIPLIDAAKFAGRRRGGRPTHVSTVRRWCDKGVDGVRLECINIGKIKHTSVPALLRFFTALTPSTADATPIRTPDQLSRAACRAEAELNRAGI